MKLLILSMLLILPEADQGVAIVAALDDKGGGEFHDFPNFQTGGDFHTFPRKFHSKRSLPIVVDRDLDKLKCLGFDQYLNLNQLCDSKADCPDGSDEFACGT